MRQQFQAWRSLPTCLTFMEISQMQLAQSNQVMQQNNDLALRFQQPELSQRYKHHQCDLASEQCFQLQMMGMAVMMQPFLRIPSKVMLNSFVPQIYFQFVAQYDVLDQEGFQSELLKPGSYLAPTPDGLPRNHKQVGVICQLWKQLRIQL
ncbi:hypothetical protein FGO68_gene8989 [Halteria grandinella]|uniref:Uncharacterized protein n=1 Tax=Halteria grandinella TaxID=5974 RepID=A0A8J8N9G4_HALGN|nr:hypothetical protein FGO68_gene8989 [Halteria grandinella]